MPKVKEYHLPFCNSISNRRYSACTTELMYDTINNQEQIMSTAVQRPKFRHRKKCVSGPIFECLAGVLDRVFLKKKTKYNPPIQSNSLNFYHTFSPSFSFAMISLANPNPVVPNSYHHHLD